MGDSAEAELGDAMMDQVGRYFRRKMAEKAAASLAFISSRDVCGVLVSCSILSRSAASNTVLSPPLVFVALMGSKRVGRPKAA